MYIAATVLVVRMRVEILIMHSMLLLGHRITPLAQLMGRDWLLR